MRVKLFAVVVVAAMLGTLFLTVFAASAAQPAANPSDPFDRIRITGIVDVGGTFDGTLSISRFYGDEQTGIVWARGTIDGLRTDASGKKTHLGNVWVWVIIPYLEGGTSQPLTEGLRGSAGAPAVAADLCSTSISLEIKLGEIKVGDDLAAPLYSIALGDDYKIIILGGQQNTALCGILSEIFAPAEDWVVGGPPLMDLSAPAAIADAGRAARLLSILRLWYHFP